MKILKSGAKISKSASAASILAAGSIHRVIRVVGLEFSRRRTVATFI